MPLDHDLRGLVQVARTAVVAEPGPQVQDFVLGRRGQCLDVGQRCHETVEVTEHGADLGLLQHDFRDPHPVGGDALLPGQVLATVTVVPVEDRAVEAFRCHLRLNSPLSASFSSGLTLSPSFSSIFFVEAIAGQFRGDLAQAFLVQAAGLGAEFQRAAAEQRPFDAGVALVDLAGRVRHVALIALDLHADAIVHAQHAQVDIAVAADRQAGNGDLQVRVAGHAVGEVQAALELAERRVLAAVGTGKGLAVG